MGRKIGLTGILCVLLAVLTACEGEGPKEDEAGSKGMGRYLETAYAFPEEINRNGGITVRTDGSLALVSYGSGFWVSADGGKTWENRKTDWFPMLENVYCLDAAVGPDGSVAASCSGEMGSAVRAAYEKELPGDWEGNYCVFAEPDGTFKVLDFGFSQEDGSCIENFTYKEDGRLFASDMNGKVCEVDVERGSVKELFTADRSVGYIGFSGETLMAVGADRLYLYDLEKQELLSQDSTADEFVRQTLADGSNSYTGGGYPLIVFGGGEDTVYLACEDGLYRHALGGSVVEQVIDGALSTFGDSTSTIYQVIPVSNGEFLAQFDPSAGLVRYTWDETVPSMPEKELCIYSLEENSTIRQAATAYKKKRMDIYVRYQVGLEEESGMTREDAIKTLNARILAGEGPDVLVLSGLPVDAYKEKGTLLDLSGILEELSGGDGIFPNLLEASADDGAVYAMPACIRVPLLAGDREILSGAADLSSLASSAERLREDCPSGGIFGIYEEETMLRLFSMACASGWRKEDGSLSEAAVREFYSQMNRIWQAEQAGARPEEIERMQETDRELEEYGIDPVENKMEACSNVLNIPSGYAKLAAGYVESIQLCLDSVTSVLREEEAMGYISFEGQAYGAFLPECPVGISARAVNSEDAKDFVRTLFSEETQRNLSGGFPVNRAAFLGIFDFMEENDSNGSMTLACADGTEKELELQWPDKEEKEYFLELVESLRTPVQMDDYLAELVVETGVQVLEGTVDSEEAAEDVVEKAAIYLAE